MHNSFTSSSLSFWQGSIWKNILLDSHQAINVEIFSYEDMSILIEFRSIGLGMVGAFSLGTDHTRYSQVFFEKAGEFAKKYGAIFWQREDYFDKSVLSLSIKKSSNKSSPEYKHFLEPYTRVIDLGKDESVILGEMHEKGRYNIRLAEKRGISTLWVKSTQENIDIWMNLLQDTTSRDGFSHNSRSYYENFLKNLATENAGGLLFAYFEEQVIAGGIFVYSGDSALYYYGASVSDREMRKHMAPYAIQWEAIQEGKRRGCILYDFLGVASPLGDDDGHLQGVTDFKEKFGGEIVQLGEKTYISLSYKEKIYSMLRFLKKLLRKK